MLKVFAAASAVLSLALATAPAQAQGFNHTITSAASPGLCLGVQETNLSHPFMAGCRNDVLAQHWLVGPPNGEGFVKLHSQRTGMDVCLGVAAANTSTLVMASCGSVKNQQWKIAPGVRGGYNLTSQLLGPNTCLGILPNSGGAELDMNSCKGAPGQAWSISGL